MRKVTPDETELSSILEEDETDNDTNKSLATTDGKPLGKLPPFLKGAIKDWWVEKRSYKSIEDTLVAAGYSVSKASLTVWAAQQWPDAIPAVDPTDPEVLAMPQDRQAVHLLWGKALVAIKNITPHRSYAVKNISDLAGAISKIAVTQQLLDKIEVDKNKSGADLRRIIDAAKEQIMAEMRTTLEHRPELLKSLDPIFVVLEGAAENVKLLQ